MSETPEPASTAIVPYGGEPKKPFYRFSSWLYATLGRIWCRLEAHHLDLLPAEGPVLVLANHQSMLDPPLIGSVQHREFHYLARDSLFRVPCLPGLMRRYNVHPIRRDGIDRTGIRTCVDVLKAGWPLLMFPEGTRTRTGRAAAPRGGFGMILDRAPGVPCMAVRIEGAFDALPRGAWFPRPRKIKITNGEPFTIEPRREGESRKAFYARCAARLEEAWRAMGMFEADEPPETSP